MKLNLLPTSVSRGGSSKFAWVICVALIAGSVYLALSMKAAGESVLTTAKADIDANQQQADNVDTVSTSADTTIAAAAGPLLNVSLAKAMDEHNSVYPKFYDQVKQYIPSYFRINSLVATPQDANTSTVTMTGVVGSFEQYADLMLELLRMPGAQAVSRSGYQLNDMYVPPLTTEDQVGRPIKANGQRLPDDAIQRLDIKIAEAGHTDFVGTGGFGTPGTPRERGAAPKESLITVAVVVSKNLMTPNPRATLAGAGGAFSAAAAPATVAATPGGAPVAPDAAGMPGSR